MILKGDMNGEFIEQSLSRFVKRPDGVVGWALLLRIDRFRL